MPWAALFGVLIKVLKPILEVLVGAFMKRAAGPKVEEVKDADAALERAGSSASDLDARWGGVLRGAD